MCMMLNRIIILNRSSWSFKRRFSLVYRHACRYEKQGSLRPQGMLQVFEQVIRGCCDKTSTEVLMTLSSHLSSTFRSFCLLLVFYIFLLLLSFSNVGLFSLFVEVSLFFYFAVSSRFFSSKVSLARSFYIYGFMVTINGPTKRVYNDLIYWSMDTESVAWYHLFIYFHVYLYLHKTDNYYSSTNHIHWNFIIYLNRADQPNAVTPNSNSYRTITEFKFTLDWNINLSLYLLLTPQLINPAHVFLSFINFKTDSKWIGVPTFTSYLVSLNWLAYFLTRDYFSYDSRGFDIFYVSLWRTANARNIILDYSYWQYTNLFIFQFVSLHCLRSTL